MVTPSPAQPLAALAASLSEPIACAGNRPIRLDDPHTVWFVEHGVLDLFVTEERDGRTVSRLKHVLRVGAGRLVFGAGATGEEASLVTVGKGLPGCRLRRMGLATLVRDAPAEELTAQVDHWIAQRAASLVADITLRPRPDRAIGPGERLEAEAACTLAGRPGAVTWVAAGGQAEFLGTEPPEPGGTGLIALTPETWLSLYAPTRANGLSSRTLHAEGRLAAALQEFHRMLASAGALNRRLTRADVLNRETSRVTWRRRDRKQARRQLFGVLRSSRAAAVEDASALRTALESIGRHEGIVFRPPSTGPNGQAPEPSVPDVLHASGVRGRRVKIRPEDRWWRGDSGALLGFRADDGRPVALLPSVAGGYRILDPDSGRATRVDAAEARRLSEDAWCFYRPLPHDAPVTPGDLLRHAGKSLTFDLSRFLVAGALAGLVTLAPAVLIGVLADRVLPMRAGGMMAQLATGLAVLAVLAALLQMLQGTALMRLEGRIAARLGAAVWDRVLGMRAEFFRRFTAGDLAVRASVFQALRDAVSGMVGGAIASVVFLVPAFFIVFLYDAVLGWVSLGLGALSLGVAVVFALAQLEPQRRRHAASRLIAGELFQLVKGIAKLRSSGAEESAYAVWARRYREQQQAMMQIGRLDGHMVAFSAAVPALAGAALFAFALRQGPDRLAVGDFLAVYAMSMIFFVTIARLGRSFEAVAAIVPGVAQVRPVLDAVPERLPAGNAAFEPGGELRLDRVSFRYSEDGPPILEDVSLHVRPGEFVAIVGESGSGKSTLLRLALGLLEPTAGAVYYDGRDLASFDPRMLRRRIGVVMQDAALRPGNILENIIGTSDGLTMRDAWQAARRAVVDEDVAAMPMGMYTAVTDSAGTFSGGQIQRILLAAALARKPRILFLDEAMRWLDARSQAEVVAGIERLLVTRVVIAHRLSTIRAADRIYVLDGGRIVQQGGFEALMESEGPFRDLMHRQRV